MTSENNTNNQRNEILVQAEKAMEQRIEFLIEDKLLDMAVEKCQKLLKLNPDNAKVPLFNLRIENEKKKLAELAEKKKNSLNGTSSSANNLLPKKKSWKSWFMRSEEDGELNSNIWIGVAAVLFFLSSFYVYDCIYSPWAKYKKICTIMDGKSYEMAISKFEKMTDYPDSIFKLVECKDILNKNKLEEKYSHAVNYTETLDYYNAVAIFKQLGLYKDSPLKELDCIYGINGGLEGFEIARKRAEKEKARRQKALEEARRLAEEQERKAAEEEARAAKLAAEEEAKRLAKEAKDREWAAEQEARRQAVALKQQKQERFLEDLETFREIEESKAEEAERIAKKKENKFTVTAGAATNYNVNGVTFVMIGCPAGSFVMGSPNNEPGRNSDESQHNVTLKRDFMIGKYEVTQAQYKAVTGLNPSASFIRGDNKPVYQITWFMAKEFCDKLNKLTSRSRPSHYHFDLPTEAQWEYACRAGYPTSFNNGKNITSTNGQCVSLDEAGWYNANIAAKNMADVGTKRPNAWNICDMHGGVWEWCKDYYVPYSSHTLTNPEGREGTQSVLRGGSRLSPAKDCRSAVRKASQPGYNGNYDVGFRIVLVAD